MRRAHLASIGSLLALTMATLAPRPACAGGLGGPTPVAAGIIAVGVAVVVADIVYTGRNIVDAGRNREPSEGSATWQTVVTAPQALLITGLVGYVAADDDSADGRMEALILPATWLNTLATYGAWTVGSRDVGPSARFGLSVPIGANIALTSYAVGRLWQGRALTHGQSALVLSLTLPQVALGTAQLARGADHAAGWAMLTAHSGALLAYGVANIAWRAGGAAPLPSSARRRQGLVAAAPTAIGEGGAGMMIFGTW
jgi:hypothetical protein